MTTFLWIQVGWEPTREDSPVINHDLISAIHRVVSSTGSLHESVVVVDQTPEHPGISVEDCSDGDKFLNGWFAS